MRRWSSPPTPCCRGRRRSGLQRMDPAQPPLPSAIGVLAVLVPLWLVRRTPARAPASSPASRCNRGDRRVSPAAPVLRGSLPPDVAPPLDNPGFRATASGADPDLGPRTARPADRNRRLASRIWAVRLLRRRPLQRSPLPGRAAAARWVDLDTSCRRWRESYPPAISTSRDHPRRTEGPLFLPPQIAWTEAGGLAVPVVRAFPAAVFLLTARPNPSQCRDLAPPGEHHGPFGPRLSTWDAAGLRPRPPASAGRRWPIVI